MSHINFLIVFPQALLYSMIYAREYSMVIKWQTLMFALSLAIIFSQPSEPSPDLIGTILEYWVHRVISIPFLESGR